ncbi:aldehyde dehydrogenase family protein [Niveispirillum lacus]|uniref:aldehyde dehydrogenase family protein n=1 Tax=Niveispirillum lacus TaxID=1981099 RepID=UPI001FE46C95|nr:aldehyde dehydrogenase family protein [Niveispirillum lacus]
MSHFDPNSLCLPSGSNFINGARVAGIGPEIPVRRPSDGQIYAHLDSAGPAQVDAAVVGAYHAYRHSGWAQAEPRQRMRVMRRWADLLEAHLDELAVLEAVGSTRTIAEARTWDIPYSAECIRFYAEFADKVGGEVAATTPDKLGLTITEPYGVVAAVAPWNLPIVMAVWKLAPAIAAGNAVVLKPSEMTPFSIVRLAELAIQAGLPAGIFNIVQGDGRSVGDGLCRHPQVAKVTFTGSTRTGAAIMTACAETGPKPVTLELGGKSPQLVFDDCPDLDKTAAIVARAITLNAGQVCVAGSRLIVQETVAEQVMALITARFRALNPAPTWDPSSTLSPIINHPQLDRIDGIVRRTVASGATLVTGGGRAAGPQDGSYFQPTILAGLDTATEAIREEIFGPVLTVQSFHDEEEALTLANDTQFGLAAGVHTGDVARALRAVRGLEAGTVWVNRYGRSNDFMLPTGGFKRSGIGKDLGREAYLANLKVKTALVEF